MKGKFLSTTAVILFLIPNVNFGQAPNLGTTSGYAVFLEKLVGQKHMLDGVSTTPGVHFTRSGKSQSPNSNVILITSANVCNVYWQVNGQFDLNSVGYITS